MRLTFMQRKVTSLAASIKSFAAKTHYAFYAAPEKRIDMTVACSESTGIHLVSIFAYYALKFETEHSD
jgi:hypothetical protein